MPVSRGEPVAVIGAGIAGLAAAFRLQQAGIPVTVFEQSAPHLAGGRMATVDRDGFRVDLGAPLLPLGYLRMARLIAEAGLAGQVIAASDLIGVAWTGTVHRGRTGTPWRLLTGGLLSALPIRDRLRLLSGLFRFRRALHPADMSGAAGLDRLSLAGYAHTRGYAPGSLNRLLDPLSSTVSLSDPDQTAAITPFLFLAMLARGGGFFTSAAGSGFLPQGLARLVPVRYQARVTSVEERTGDVAVTLGFPGEPEQTAYFAAAVLAVPSTAVPSLYPQLAAGPRAFLASTRYSDVLQVTFCLDRPTNERSVILHASRDDAPLIASFLLPHNLSPHRVPGGRGMITSYLRGPASAELWELADDKITDAVLAGIGKLGVLPEAARNTVAVHIDRISPGVVSRRPGEYRALALAVRTMREDALIQLASGDHFGNSAAVASVSAGERAAGRLIARFLAARDAPQ